MNLRLPIVVSIVTVAAGVAAVRTLHPAPAAPPDAFVREGMNESQPPRRFVSPRPASAARAVVYVVGAVAHAGIYRLPSASRADDAVRAAGGATTVADMAAINLAAPIADGDEIVVPEKGAADDIPAATGNPAASHRKHKRHGKKGRKRHRRIERPGEVSRPGAGGVTNRAADNQDTVDDAAPAAPIDLNTADASELETLPGIGSKLAERIVTFREINGPFAAHDDLLDVGGMTQKRLDAIEPFLI